MTYSNKNVKNEKGNIHNSNRFKLLKT